MIALVIIAIFILLEFSNVLSLYFNPGSTRGNAVGVFSAWEKTKQDPEIHNFVKYLVYWVAGTKLIFISLLVVIFAFADPFTQSITFIAMIISTATFYWRMFPLIRTMDTDSQLTQSGYSRTLGGMIAFIIILFVLGYLFASGLLMLPVI
ncbi:MAG: hypothetical protein GF411_15640 [Candidatus Lokiarchaeota archaeon]|nr:hypothetical protein [Candidatus Lokiarchaeota archaeon]